MILAKKGTMLAVSAVLASCLVGGLPAAGFAAPAQASPPAVSPQVSVRAVQNFGLTTQEAKYVQCWLRDWGYTGPIDGLLGTESWKAYQRFLKQYYGYTGAIDGDPGPNTIRALQREMRNYGYTGPIDGIAGPGTRAAFKRMANSLSWCIAR
jgi:peptidoglycan hydrolase-like protein with peptidoglycan-binding domain